MMPLGMRCKAVLMPLMTSVWPALWPPWKRTTPWAISVSQSTSLPLPSWPHWVPTTTTLRPGVLFRDGEEKKRRGSERAHGPAGAVGDQLAVALELVQVALVPREHAHHDLALRAQRGDGVAQRGLLAPRRADGGARRALGDHADQLLQVEREAGRRPVAAEHGADFVVAAAARERIAGARRVDREA